MFEDPLTSCRNDAFSVYLSMGSSWQKASMNGLKTPKEMKNGAGHFEIWEKLAPKLNIL